MAFLESLKEAAKDAWYDTVMPLASEEQRRTRSFKDYFLGAHLGVFAIIPTIVNLVRRPPAFLLNFMAELLYQGQKALQSRLGDYASAALILALPEIVFSVTARLFRMVISPVESVYVTQMWINDNMPQNGIFKPYLTALNVLSHLSMAAVLFAIFVVNVAIPPLWIALPSGGLAVTMFTDIMELNEQGVLFSTWATAIQSSKRLFTQDFKRPATEPRFEANASNVTAERRPAVDTVYQSPLHSPEPAIVPTAPYSPPGISPSRGSA